MIRAVLHPTDGSAPTAVLLGFSRANFGHLLEDDTMIRFNLAELGLPSLEVIVVVEETEQAIVAKMQAAGHAVNLRPSGPPNGHGGS